MGILCEFYYSQKTNVYSPNLIILLHSASQCAAFYLHSARLFHFSSSIKKLATHITPRVMLSKIIEK